MNRRQKPRQSRRPSTARRRHLIHPRRRGGFTLIELLVVLAIGLALVAVVPPMFSGGVSSAEMKSAARRLAAGLREARSQAITRGEPAALLLDLEQREFGISGDKRRASLPEALDIELFTARADTTETGGAIRFFPDGSSTGGRITLMRDEDDEGGYEVDVAWLTGRVTIY